VRGVCLSVNDIRKHLSIVIGLPRVVHYAIFNEDNVACHLAKSSVLNVEGFLDELFFAVVHEPNVQSVPKGLLRAIELLHHQLSRLEVLLRIAIRGPPYHEQPGFAALFGV
jgi:hypothetical protein